MMITGKFTVYFVLKGLHNGEHGVTALRNGAPSGSSPMADGWYWFSDDDEDITGGPHDSDRSARDAAEAALAPERVVLGHVFRHMEEDDWNAYEGAEPGTRIAHTSHGVLLLAPDGTVSEFKDDDASHETVWSPASYR